MYKEKLTEEDWICSSKIFGHHNCLPVSKGLRLVEADSVSLQWILLAQGKRGLSNDDKLKKDTFIEPSHCVPKPP